MVVGRLKIHVERLPTSKWNHSMEIRIIRVSFSARIHMKSLDGDGMVQVTTTSKINFTSSYKNGHPISCKKKLFSIRVVSICVAQPRSILD